MDNRKAEHPNKDQPKAEEKKKPIQGPNTSPDAEGRDRPPSKSDRDPNGPWLGGG